MFWDWASIVYDLYTSLTNAKVNKRLCELTSNLIAPTDYVLECACGTGMLSVNIAKHCNKLVATDYSKGMLAQTSRKCKHFTNVSVQKADLMKLGFAADTFDKVIAANVFHLLDSPTTALQELIRVCKPGGIVIIPTYVKKETRHSMLPIKIMNRLGAKFQKMYTFAEYQSFFIKSGYPQTSFLLVEGHLSCAFALLTKGAAHSLRITSV